MPSGSSLAAQSPVAGGGNAEASVICQVASSRDSARAVPLMAHARARAWCTHPAHAERQEASVCRAVNPLSRVGPAAACHATRNPNVVGPFTGPWFSGLARLRGLGLARLRSPGLAVYGARVWPVYVAPVWPVYGAWAPDLARLWGPGPGSGPFTPSPPPHNPDIPEARLRGPSIRATLGAFSGPVYRTRQSGQLTGHLRGP